MKPYSISSRVLASLVCVSTLFMGLMCGEEAILPYSFDTLLFGDKEGTMKKVQLGEKDQQLVSDLFNDFRSSLRFLSLDSETYRIPRKLHWIWIGPKPFPKESIHNVQTWKKQHPDWEFYFWTDSETTPLPVAGMVRRLVTSYDFSPLSAFLSKTDNWGEKADIIRFVLLKKEGGIYIDHDAACEKPFDILALNFDFVVALEKPGFYETLEAKILPSNALICSVPNHPILEHTIQRIASIWDEVQSQFPEEDPLSKKERVIHRTFLSFAQSALQFRNAEGFRTLILPTAYFYPDQIFQKGSLKKIKEQKIPFANHTYASAWTQKEESSQRDSHS